MKSNEAAGTPQNMDPAGVDFPVSESPLPCERHKGKVAPSGLFKL